MIGAGELSSSSSSSSSAAWSSTADCAIADYSHDLAGELAIVPAHARRDDAGLDGHRPTELERDEAAA